MPSECVYIVSLVPLIILQSVYLTADVRLEPYEHIETKVKHSFDYTCPMRKVCNQSGLTLGEASCALISLINLLFFVRNRFHVAP